MLESGARDARIRSERHIVRNERTRWGKRDNREAETGVSPVLVITVTLRRDGNFQLFPLRVRDNDDGPGMEILIAGRRKGTGFTLPTARNGHPPSHARDRDCPPLTILGRACRVEWRDMSNGRRGEVRVNPDFD